MSEQELLGRLNGLSLMIELALTKIAYNAIVAGRERGEPLEVAHRWVQELYDMTLTAQESDLPETRRNGTLDSLTHSETRLRLLRDTP